MLQGLGCAACAVAGGGRRAVQSEMRCPGESRWLVLHQTYYQLVSCQIVWQFRAVQSYALACCTAHGVCLERPTGDRTRPSLVEQCCHCWQLDCCAMLQEAESAQEQFVRQRREYEALQAAHQAAVSGCGQYSNSCLHKYVFGTGVGWLTDW